MTSHRIAPILVSILACLVVSLGIAAAQPPVPSPSHPAAITPPVLVVPPAAQPSAHFDPEAATEAWLAQIPAAAKARSDAYFEGGYWLILWDFLYASAVCLILLKFRWSARMRDWAERITRFKPVQTFLYWLQYVVVTSILGFPLAVYEGFFRERQYGLATQTFGPWMGDQLKELLVLMVLGGILTVVLFGVVRR
ncbi:MAG TPA: hypothetical protein VLV54_04470, partial [Thermoanaerobaculia bacterium]|nr:hypothetical protein [Thermoanaerobaculia bacterium]